MITSAKIIVTIALSSFLLTACCLCPGSPCGSWSQNLNTTYELNDTGKRDLDDQNAKLLKENRISDIDECNRVWTEVFKPGKLLSNKHKEICSTRPPTDKDRNKCLSDDECKQMIMDDGYLKILPLFKKHMTVCDKLIVDPKTRSLALPK